MRLLAVALLVLTALSGCVTIEDRRIFEDAKLVLPLLAKDGTGSFSFYAGPYRGGTAVLGGHTEAFWVKDGQAYAVNDKAKELGPALPVSPPEVICEELIKAAIQGGH